MTDTVITACPDAVRAYLILTDGADHTAAAPLFADDAVVTDDGRDYRGGAAIRGWLDHTVGEYSYTRTPITVDSDPDTGWTTVRCRLEGTFPGGRVDLDHRFRLDDGRRIARLEIVPSADQSV